MIQKKNHTLKLGILIVIILSLTSIINTVSAYQRLCLTYGQSLPSADHPRYTCYSDVCQVCVTDNNYPTHPGYCKDISGCSSGGSSELDVTPPELQINSPINGEVYNSRKVLFDLVSNEPASLYYLDNINGRGRWKRLASKKMSYSRSISLKDGANSITIKAVDRNNNAIEIVREFFVDSKKPKISRTYPRKGFTEGNFQVKFKEENPVNLKLHYGNENKGYQTKNVELSECYPDKKYLVCDTNADVEAYEGSDIEYWFELEDIAGTTVESKHIKLKVDTTLPKIINTPQEPLYNLDGRRVKFNINIIEENFDEVSYIDYSENRPRYRRICSRLKDNVCEKTKSFRYGNHILDIKVSDKAGNEITRGIEFYI